MSERERERWRDELIEAGVLQPVLHSVERAGSSATRLSSQIKGSRGIKK